MGRYIHVNLDTLGAAASALESYASSRTRLVKELTQEVDGIQSSWSGDDSTAFVTQWRALSGTDGIITSTGNSIKGYLALLQQAKQLYEKAQEESVNEISQISGS